MNRAKRTAWLFVLGLLLGGLLVLILVNPTRTTADERQERMEVAGSPLEADQFLTQTFYANHDGLSGVELVVARFSQTSLPVETIITFEVYAEGQSTPLRSVSLQTDTLEHNEHLRVSWEPIADSASNAYTLSISTPEDLSMGFWQTQTEAYAYGGIQQGDTTLSGDLWFVTYYDYNWLDALSDAFTVTGRWLPYLAALLLVLFAPGWALTHLLGLNAHQSLYGRLYLIAALSMIFWPLLILWSGTLSLNAGGAVVWVLVALLVVWAILQRPRQRSLRLRFGTPELVMTVVMILIVLARLHDIRNVVLPLWVDSVHHSVITDIISHLGGVPTTYEPYMPVGNFHYHFGFHSLCAALTWFSDLPSEQAVLLMGQVMNIMAPLAAYYLAEQLTCSRWTGVLAAVVTGALSYLPAYLVTWGRYTELAGLVLLPAVLLLTRSALDRPRRLLPAALATASLCLVHYRVFVLYLLALPFLLLAKKNLGARAGRLLATGLTGALLILPWILRFALAVPPDGGHYLWFVVAGLGQQRFFHRPHHQLLVWHSAVDCPGRRGCGRAQSPLGHGGLGVMGRIVAAGCQSALDRPTRHLVSRQPGGDDCPVAACGCVGCLAGRLPPTVAVPGDPLAVKQDLRRCDADRGQPHANLPGVVASSGHHQSSNGADGT